MVIRRGGDDERGRVSGVLQTRLDCRAVSRKCARAQISRDRRACKARRERDRVEHGGRDVAFEVSRVPYASPSPPCSSSHSSSDTSVSDTSPATPTPWLYISSSESPADVPPWLEPASPAESLRAPSRRCSLAPAIVTRPDVARPTARSDRETRGAECLSRADFDAGCFPNVVAALWYRSFGTS